MPVIAQEHSSDTAPKVKTYALTDLNGDTIVVDTVPATCPDPLPTWFFAPVVFDTYQYLDTTYSRPTILNTKATRPKNRFDREIQQSTFLKGVQQRYMIEHPQSVHYNIAFLPDPPKKYTATVDPATSMITIKEDKIDPSKLTAGKPVEIKRYNWIHSFDGSLQFSQAYISPNWYQGGNNSINAIASLNYGIKLNPAYHPNVLFETTAQYKLAMSNAPSDELRDYTISEDQFLLTSKFGFRALKRWFYTFNLSFKTQFLDNYKPNSNDLTAAFMSPGELNLGIGMTYDYANAKKTVVFGASISPLSYNLKACTRTLMDETAFGIKQGHTTVSQFGSSAELKFSWKISYNISYTSRLFLFSDYSYMQGDWENTFNFNINRFLSTQLYVHLRYDSSTTDNNYTKWKDWQLKEILSFGFAYRFTTH